MEDELIDELILEKLRECFNYFGIEGTEDAINRNLTGTLKERFLYLYRKVISAN